MTMAYLSNAEVARAMRMVADADPFGLGNASTPGEGPTVIESGVRAKADAAGLAKVAPASSGAAREVSEAS
jgi:hypothetical protein